MWPVLLSIARAGIGKVALLDNRRPGSLWLGEIAPRNGEYRVRSYETDLPDFAVYGRYIAAARASSQVIYTQDDDCVLPPESIQALLDGYERRWVTANMPPEFRHNFYTDHFLVGFGAVFHQDLLRKLATFDEAYGYPTREFYRHKRDPSPAALRFARTADVVFTGLNRGKLLNVPYKNLPWATGDDRMYRQADHVDERQETREMVAAIRV